MTGLKKSWDIYKNEFLKKDVKIEEIEIFLKDTYSKELRKYNIEGIGVPYNRWKYRLKKDLGDLTNIVYIKCFINKDKESRPLICGVTKTGGNQSLDINLDIYANDGRPLNVISGRIFLQENNFKYDTKNLYAFDCDNPIEAILLERAIQKEFNLFSS